MAFMTTAQRTQLTEEIARRFDLPAEHIMQLEASPLYPRVMDNANTQQWTVVEQLLEEIRTGVDR